MHPRPQELLVPPQRAEAGLPGPELLLETGPLRPPLRGEGFGVRPGRARTQPITAPPGSRSLLLSRAAPVSR